MEQAAGQGAEQEHDVRRGADEGSAGDGSEAAIAEVLGVEETVLDAAQQWCAAFQARWWEIIEALGAGQLWGARVRKVSFEQLARVGPGLRLDLQPAGEHTVVGVRLYHDEEGRCVVQVGRNGELEQRRLGEAAGDEELEQRLESALGREGGLRSALQRRRALRLISRAVVQAGRWTSSDGAGEVEEVQRTLIVGLGAVGAGEGDGVLCALAEGWAGTPGQLLEAAAKLDDTGQ